ncbi:MAG: hypothetical protein LIP03_02725 [Bacteroidales bacterium]|nr:hypothetical protein [Bacteroidales bacterium]
MLHRIKQSDTKQHIAALRSMQLYSTDHTAATEQGTREQTAEAVGQGESASALVPWSYLFVPSAQLDLYEGKIRRAFPTFVHRVVVCKREGGRIEKKEKPTIAGLIFVHGEPEGVQEYLCHNLSALHLVRDSATGRPARIDPREMDIFMRVSRAEGRTFRFMPNPLASYAVGNQLVRITSGPFAGLEGYVARISRDKHLVIQFGSLTLALSGICKDDFENADEYLMARRAEQPDDQVRENPADWQARIDRAFFQPENSMDMMALCRGLERWIERMRQYEREAGYAEIIRYSLAIVNRIGHCLCGAKTRLWPGQIHQLKTLVRQVEGCLLGIDANPGIRIAEKLRIQSAIKSSRSKYPFLW